MAVRLKRKCTERKDDNRVHICGVIMVNWDQLSSIVRNILNRLKEETQKFGGRYSGLKTGCEFFFFKPYKIVTVDKKLCEILKGLKI